MKSTEIRICLWAAILIALLSVNAAAQGPERLHIDKSAAQVRKPIQSNKLHVIEHWTKERRAKAVPRDLVIDSRGLGYLKRPDGYLQPYGHDIAAQVTQRNHSISPFANSSVGSRRGGKGGGGGGGGGGSGDKTPPTITVLDPTEVTIIGESHTFEARVTDASGVRSVTFHIQKSGSSVQSFSATNPFSSDVWGANFSGFTNGDWTWWVEAKDGARKGGNTAVSEKVAFQVTADINSGEWTNGGSVQTAAGRIYFEMPDDPSLSTWSGYVCSGTVATDGTDGRSVIITAAHCVYDDLNSKFARNTLFIPNQAGSSSGTDLNCGNDPMGCWVPSFGVVDLQWANQTFPNNMAWDYGFYVVPDFGAHLGNQASSDVLDVAAQSIPLSFAAPNHDVANSKSDYTYAFGYSYKDDPKLMYCAEDMTTEDTGFAVSWWLPNCELTGGSSGGPWMQPMDEATGSDTITSFNSWGYVWNGMELPGMGGPNLVSPANGGASSASCIFENAKSTAFGSVPSTDGHAGKVVNVCP